MRHAPLIDGIDRSDDGPTPADDILWRTLDTLGVAIAMVDGERQITFSTTPFRTLFDLPDDCRGLRLDRVGSFAPFAPRLQLSPATLRQSGEPSSAPGPWIDLGAERVWGHVVAMRARPQSGGGLALIACSADSCVRSPAILTEFDRRFRDFAASCADWFWETDAELRYVWLSDNAGDATGCDPSTIIGKRRDQIASDRNDERKWSSHLAVLAARQPFRNFNYRVSATDGSTVHLQVSGIPVFGREGNFQGYRGTGANITHRVIAEREARAAQRRLEDAIESIGDGFCLLDRNDRLVLFNLRFAGDLAHLADVLQPGLPYRHVLETMVEQDMVELPAGDAKEWLAQTLADRETAPVTRSYRTRSGQAVEVREFPTSDGGRVVIGSDITERRDAEERLAISEERFRVAFNASPDGFLVTRIADQTIVMANESLLSLVGLPRERVIGMKSGELGCWDDPTPYRQFISDVGTSGRVALLPQVVRQPDGETRDVLISAHIVDMSGEPYAFQVIRDVSHVRRVESNVRVLWRAVEHAPAIVFITDNKGVIQYINQKFTELTGYTADEALGKTPRILKSGETPEHVYAEAWRTITSGGTWQGELRNRCKDGRYYWARASICPVRGTDNAISHYIAVQLDVTEEMKARSELEASEARYRSLVETSALGILILQEGRPVFVNRTASSLFGYRQIRDILELGSAAPLFEANAIDRLATFEKTGCCKNQNTTLDFEARCWRADRASIWLHVYVNKIPWNGSKAIQLAMHDVTLRRTYEEQLYHQANYDALTELPNRSMVIERLSSAANAVTAGRSPSKVGILFIDVDHFKRINDTLGHAVGDAFLQQAAQRIAACVRQTDVVARLGGDEFMIMVTGLRLASNAESVARKIVDAFKQPFMIEGREMFMSVSIGVTVTPDDGTDAATLMRNADMAMYMVKTSGRGSWRRFAPGMTEEAERRAQVEDQLRHALERGELEIHYQPIVNLDSGEVTGAEALLRWNNPVLGTITPDRFIPIAEETGLIVPIGAWVLETACREAVSWRLRGHAPIRLAVNVSGRQFRCQTIVDTVSRIIHGEGFPADLLELEITETVLMDNVSESQAILETLEKLGVNFSIDDFGTGYSSLSYLNRFRLDTLKIDRSFTSALSTDNAHSEVVDAIIAMAHRLNLAVIAEGVETTEQLRFLRARGCDKAQGYLFSRPVPAAQFLDLLDGWRNERLAISA